MEKRDFCDGKSARKDGDKQGYKGVRDYEADRFTGRTMVSTGQWGRFLVVVEGRWTLKLLQGRHFSPETLDLLN